MHWIIALCLLMLDALTWVTLALWGDWQTWMSSSDLLALGLLLATQGLLLFLLARSLVQQRHQRRLIRAVFASQPASITVSTLQYDAPQVLMINKTLLLERHLRVGPIWQTILLVPGGLFIVCVIAINALTVFLHVPAPHPHQHSARILLISLTILAPLIECILVYAHALFTIFARRQQRVQLDDSGITVCRSLHRPVFIAWEQMRAGLLIPAQAEQGLSGIVWIGNQESGIAFDTGLVTPLLHRPQFVPVGGMDTYLAALQQLFATITARSSVMWHVPQRQANQIAVMQERFKQRNELARGKADALAEYQAALAEAPAPLQPAPALIALASIRLLPLMVRPRFPIGIWLKNTLGLFAVLMALTSSMIYGRLIARYHEFQSVQFVVIVFAVVAVALFLYSARFGWMIARDRYPSLIADERGVTLQKGTRPKRKSLNWNDITFWGCCISDGGDIAYTLTSPTMTLTWIERAHGELAGRGNRQVAFRERCEELHALIASRTGLLLRLYPNDEL